ncbi:MAG: ABC transporter substrate-binding protein [Chloroflexota bacterium]
MRRGNLFLLVSLLTVLGLLLASCASTVAPTATPKPEAPAPAKAQPAAPTAKPAAPAPTKAPAAVPTPKPAAPAPTPKPAAPTPSPKPAAEQPKYGGVLAIGYYTDVASLDVHQEASGAMLMVVSPAYSGLLQYSPLEVDKVVPDLARQWDVSQDGKVYTFHLQQNVKWHDGTPFGAEDVRFSLDRIRKPPTGTRSPRSILFKGIAQVKVPDKDTVTIELADPSAAFVSTMAGAWQKIMPKHVIESRGHMKDVAVGTGPFKLKQYATGVVYEFVKNQDYFIKGRPYVDGVTFYVIRDSGTRFAAFRSRRTVMTSQSNGLTPSQAEVVKNTMPDASVGQSVAGNWWNFFMNLSKKPWNDIRVRQAVNLATDRQQAIKIIDEGYGEQGLYMPPGTWGLPDSEVLKLPGYRQPKDADRQEAKRLLAEAGYPDGFTTTVMTRAGAYYEKGGIFMKDQLATIGIRADLDVRDQTVIFERLGRHDYDSACFKEGLDVNDPTVVLKDRYMGGAGRNYSGFSDKLVDELLDKQDTMLDEAKRKETVLQIQRRILELQPVALTHWGVYLTGWWKELRDFNAAVPRYSNSTYTEVWLDK